MIVNGVNLGTVGNILAGIVILGIVALAVFGKLSPEWIAVLLAVCGLAIILK